MSIPLRVRLAAVDRIATHAGSGYRVVPGTRWDDRLLLPGGDSQVFAFADEAEAALFFIPVDADEIAGVHLFSGQQIGERIDHVTFNSTLQVPRTIAPIRAFLQKEVAACVGHAEPELS